MHRVDCEKVKYNWQQQKGVGAQKCTSRTTKTYHDYSLSAVNGGSNAHKKTLQQYGWQGRDAAVKGGWLEREGSVQWVTEERWIDGPEQGHDGQQTMDDLTAVQCDVIGY